MSSDIRPALLETEVRGIDPRIDDVLNARLKAISDATIQLQAKTIREPRAVAPEKAFDGQLEFADGVNWDPFGIGVPYWTYYSDGAWQLLGTGGLFAYAAYGDMYYSGAALAWNDIGGTFQSIDIFNAQSISSPRGINVDLTNDHMTILTPGVFMLTVGGSFNHDNLNAGRTTMLRLYDVVSGTGLGTGFQIGVGRNVDTTAFSLAIPLEVDPGASLHGLQLQIGGGDTITAVEWLACSYVLHSIGEYRGGILWGRQQGAFSDGFSGAFA